MDGSEIVRSPLVSKTQQGLNGIREDDHGVNAKYGTGSNEPRFSTKTAMKLAVAVLMVLGTLAFADILLIAKNKPTIRVDGAKLSFESSTSSDATLTVHGGLKSNSAFHSMEVTAGHCELQSNEDGKSDHWLNMGSIRGTKASASQNSAASSLAFEFQNTDFASLRRLLYATALNRPLGAAMRCAIDVNAYMYHTVTVPGQFLIDLQVLAPTSEVASVVLTTSALWAGNKLYESVSTTEIDRTTVPAQSAAGRVLQSLNEADQSPHSSLNSLVQTLMDMLKYPQLEQVVLDRTFENPFFQFVSSHALNSFVVAVPALSVAATAFGDDTEGGRFVLSSTAFELELVQPTLHFKSEIKLQCSDSNILSGAPVALHACDMFGPTKLFNFYQKLSSNRLHLSMDAVSHDFVTKLAGPHHSFKAEFSDVSAVDTQIEQRLSAAPARSAPDASAAGLTALSMSRASAGIASMDSRVTEHGSCVTMDTDSVYTLYVCSDDGPASLKLRMHLLDESEITMATTLHSAWAEHGPLSMHTEMQLRVSEGHHVAINNTISESERSIKTVVDYQENGESRVNVDAAVNWQLDSHGESLKRIELRSRIDDRVFTKVEDLCVESDVSLMDHKFTATAHASHVTVESEGQYDFTDLLKWFVELTHLRVLSHGDAIVNIDARAHVDEASGVGIMVSVIDGDAKVLGSVDNAVTWSKPLNRDWETDGHFKASSAVHTPVVDWDVESVLDYEHSEFAASVSSNRKVLLGTDGSFGLSDAMWWFTVREAAVYSGDEKVVDSALSVFLDKARSVSGALSFSAGEGDNSTRVTTDMQLTWSDPAHFATEMHLDLVTNTTQHGLLQNSSYLLPESFTTVSNVDYHLGDFSAAFSVHDRFDVETLLLVSSGRYEQSSTVWLLAADEVILFTNGKKNGSVMAAVDYTTAPGVSLQSFLLVRDDHDNILAATNNSFAWSTPAQAGWEEAGSISFSSAYEPLWLVESSNSSASNNTAHNESRKLSLMDTSSVPVCTSSTTQLDLSHQDLTEVPDLSACVSLTHIKLNWNPRLSSLPDSLFDLPALLELSIFECGFTSLSPRIGLMPQLRYLDAHENNISVIPAEIASLSTLRYLDLSANRIAEFPVALCDVTGMEELRLHGNPITALPQEIGNMRNLTLVVLSENLLQALPAEMSQLHRLTYLDISANDFPVFPPVLNTLSNLEILVSTRNNLQTLPVEIVGMSRLKDLYLSTNLLATLPVELVNMASLRTLFVDSNRVTSLPKQLIDIPSLSYLKVSHNLLQYISPDILQHPGLYVEYDNNPIVPLAPVCNSATFMLDLSYQNLTELPDFKGCHNLEILNIEGNKLTFLPTRLFNLTKLIELNAQNNRLTSLNTNINRLDYLESLYLQDNKLTSLPKQIGGLASLLEIHVDGNQLTSLPEEIGEIRTLELLSVTFNDLRYLPYHLRYCTRMLFLYVNDNPFLNVFPYDYYTLTKLRVINALRTQISGFHYWVYQLPFLETLRYNNEPSLRCDSTTTSFDLSYRNYYTFTLPSFEECTNLVSLDLSGNNLDDLPLSIFRLSKLTWLRLFNTQLRALPAEIEALSELRFLELSYNYLSVLPEEIGGLRKLEEFKVNYNYLNSLPYGIGQLTALTNLEVVRNNIRQLPGEIGGLTNLRNLNLDESYSLVGLPKEFGMLTSLYTLRMYNNYALKSLPLEFGNLTALNEISAPYCGALKSLPSTFGNLRSLTRLDFQGSGLVSLPEGFGRLTNLDALQLQNSYSLASLSSDFGGLVRLSVMFVESCRLTQLPASFGGCTSLRHLRMYYNRLTTLPESFGQLRSLNYLHLQGNDLRGLPESFGDLAVLNELYLIANPSLTALPASFGKLSALGRLYINSNDLRSLPESFGNLTSLFELSMGYNPSLMTLPASFGRLTQLRTLSIESANLQSWPSAVNLLVNLNSLFMNDNPNLGSLPDSFYDLPMLRELHMYNCGLTTLSPRIGQMTRLYRINLSNNKLSTLPAELAALTNMRIFHLSNNKFVHFPSALGGMQYLEVLYINSNPLTTIPPEIANMQRLRELIMSDCALQVVPLEMGQMTSLRFLNIGANGLLALPKEICGIVGLTRLYAGNNKLQTLPVEIGNLQNLQELYVYQNNLTSLPAQIGNMTSLRYLFVYLNRLTQLPPEIINIPDLYYIDVSSNRLQYLSPVLLRKPGLSINYYDNPIYPRWEYPQYPPPAKQEGWKVPGFLRYIYNLLSVSWDARAHVDYKDNAYNAMLSEGAANGGQNFVVTGGGNFGKNGARNWYFTARDYKIHVDEQLVGSTSGQLQIRTRDAAYGETIDLALNGQVYDNHWLEVFGVNSTAMLQLSAPLDTTCSVSGQAATTFGDVTGHVDYVNSAYTVDASAIDITGGGTFSRAFNLPSILPNLCMQPKRTHAPTAHPTMQPTVNPTVTPSVGPSHRPSVEPSVVPSVVPSANSSVVPTVDPTNSPTELPSVTPSTAPSAQPSVNPSASPSMAPSAIPTRPTAAPTDAPTNAPNSTPDPTATPSFMPTYDPSQAPTIQPTETPSFSPSNDPSQTPSVRPSEAPVFAPTLIPTVQPSLIPSAAPSVAPTCAPTSDPSIVPSEAPSMVPSLAPSAVPSFAPSRAPSDAPSFKPSNEPSVTPSAAPSMVPSLKPSSAPSVTPSVAPSVVPTCSPSAGPSKVPTARPSAPTLVPSLQPTAQPTIRVSARPSSAAPTLDNSAPEVTAITSTAHRSSISLVVSFNATAVLAGSVTCATFPSGTSGVNNNQRVLTAASSKRTPYLAGSTDVSVEIDGLSAMNEYDVYCVVVTINGVSSQFSSTEATKQVVETACCKTVTFSNAPAFVYGSLTQYATAQPNQYVFSYSLSASPRDSVVFTPTVFNLDGSTVSSSIVTVSPASSTFASTGNNLNGKFVLSAASTLSGSYTITLVASGTSSAQYRNATVSVSVISSAAPKPAPALTGAKFANNGGSLLIAFSSATNKASIAAQTFACSDLLSFAGDSTATCSWVNGASLRAVLASSAISVGSSLALKANLVKAECAAGQDCSGYSAAALQSVSVAAPDTAIVPVVLLTTPAVVSSCDDVVIDASMSTGSGGRAWSSAVWTVSRADALGAVAVPAVLAALNSHGVNIATPIVIERALFTPSKYTLTLTLTNFLGQSSIATAIFGVDENPNLPIVSILGPVERSLTPIDTLNLYTTITQASCAEKASAISYKWTVLENGNAFTKSSYSATPTRFSLLPYSLNVGSVYTFLFEATASATANTDAITGRSTATVKIVSGAVVVAVVGGNNRQVPAVGQLSIDASPSYDENVQSRVTTGLTFAWTCTYATPSKYGESCASVMGATSTSVLVVDATQLDSSDLYAFQVVVKAADGRSALSVVTVQPQIAGSTTFTTINTLITKINPDNKINLHGVVRATYGLDCTWTAAVDGVNIPLNALTSTRETFSRVAVRNNFAFGLLIQGNTFVPGSTVTFRLGANFAGNSARFSSFSEINIKMNAPPSGGFVDVNPPSGSALSTSFVVSTAGWTDDAEDFPLSYQFQYQTLASQPLLNIQIRSPANKVSANLPAGPDSSGNAIILVCTVYDAALSTTTLSTTATVTENVVIDVTQYVNEQLSNFDSVGDVNTVGQLIANVGSTVNKVKCTQASDSFCASRNRGPCSTKPQTCSTCLESYSGAPAESNGMCRSNARRMLTAVEVGGTCSADTDCLLGKCTDGKCVSPPKLCPSDTTDVCSGHGSCKYATRSGKPLNKVCTESDFECIAQCECTDGYGGQGCGLSPQDLNKQDQIRAALCNAVITVGNNSDPSVQLLESLVGYLDTAFDAKEVTSAESLSVCQGAMHFVGDLVLANGELVKDMAQTKLDQLLKTASKFVARRSSASAEDGKYIHQLISTLNEAILGSMVNGQAPYSYATQNMRTIISKARIGEVTSLAPPQTDEEVFYGGAGVNQARNSYIEVVNTSTSSQFANSEGYMSLVVMLWGDNPFPGATAVESAMLRVENHNFNSANRILSNAEDVAESVIASGRQLAATEQTDYYIVVQLNEQHAFDRSHSISEATALGLTNFTFPECTNFDGSSYETCAGCSVSTYTDYNVTFACSASAAAASRRLSGSSDGSVNQFGAKFATPNAITPPDSTDSSSDNSNNLALIIGLSVGIPCLVLLLLGLLYYFRVAKSGSSIKVVPVNDVAHSDYP